MTLHPEIAAVTARIVTRSKPTRDAYLALIARARDTHIERPAMGCANAAHAYAGTAEDREALTAAKAMNIGIVTSYNDMLSAHAPYYRYPEQMKVWAREAGATAQVAGGVPAMCDGVTQGYAGMELSLFSRDTIALSTAIALSHGVFEGAALLGICDKIVPGLLMGALRFGHLPMILIPAGPMASGLPNKEKAAVREAFAEGKVGREALLEAEIGAYHSKGTCTFYGTANSNQMMLEMMGLHMPGTAFVNPGTKLRQELTRAAVHRLAGIGWHGEDYRPLGLCVDEKAIVNAAIGLLATGGSTNHLLHLPAIAACAGIVIDWEDFDRLSRAVPLIARVYPNGSADVNGFEGAGGMGVRDPRAGGCGAAAPRPADGRRRGHDRLRAQADTRGARIKRGRSPGSIPASAATTASCAHLSRRLHRRGASASSRAISGGPASRSPRSSATGWIVEAPARVFHDQLDVIEAFRRGELERDVVVVGALPRGHAPTGCRNCTS